MNRDKPLDVVAYLRVSTDGQAEHGVSLAAQAVQVSAYASLYGLRIVEVVEDRGLSAKTLDRPGLDRVLSHLRDRRAAGMLVSKLDRLTRSVRDLGTLVDRYFRDGGAALLSVSEQIDTRSASGRLVLNVLTSVAQWEREATGERTALALAHKARMGEFTGGRVPFGYRLDSDGVHLVSDPMEAQVIAAALEAHAEGLPLRTIARELDRLGFRSRAGHGFHPQQVSRMLAENAA